MLVSRFIVPDKFLLDYIFDQFILKPHILGVTQGFFANLPSLATLIVAPSVIFYVLKIYWK